MEPRNIYMTKQNEQYKVDDDIPLPQRRMPRTSKYPFNTMSPNQSVFVPEKTYAAVIGSLRKPKSEGKKFSVHRSENGWRVWRIQ